jgi:hypothetical protein
MGKVFSCFKPTNEVERPLITNGNNQQYVLKTTEVERPLITNGNNQQHVLKTTEVERPLITNGNNQQHVLKTTSVVFKLTDSSSPQDFNRGVSRYNHTTFTNSGIQYNNNSCLFDCLMMMLFGCGNRSFLHLLQGQPEGSLGHMILTLVFEPLQRVGYVPSTAYGQIRQKITELTGNQEFLYRAMDLSELLIALEDHIPSWKMCSSTSSTGISLPPQSIIVGGIDNLSPSGYLKTLTFSSPTSGFFVEVSGSSNIAMSHSIVIDDKTSKKLDLTGLLSINTSPHFTCIIYNHKKGRWIFFDDNGTSDDDGCVPVVIELPSSFQSYLDRGCVNDSLVSTTDEKGVKITDRMKQLVFAFYS